MTKKLISIFLLTVMVFNISQPCFCDQGKGNKNEPSFGEKFKEGVNNLLNSRPVQIGVAVAGGAAAVGGGTAAGAAAANKVGNPRYPSADEIRDSQGYKQQGYKNNGCRLV